jgi:hypothetical protein
MHWRASLAVLMLAAASHGQMPADAGQPGMLEETRRIALNYSKALPDFVCTEAIHRYQAYGLTGAFRSTDILTLQLTYFQFHENYKLLARNGHPTTQSLESVGGAWTEGEFGSTLLQIFHHGSKAEFAFKQWARIGDRRAAVYTYRVERANSRFELRVSPDSAIAGYHGEVFIDADTHRVLRIAQVIDVPDGLPVQSSSNTGEYGFVDVSGHQYLLPVRWESLSVDLPALHSPARAASDAAIIHPWQKPPYPVTGRNGSGSGSAPQMAAQMRYRNLIEFRDYRKYAAESTLSFDPPGPPKQ